MLLSEKKEEEQFVAGGAGEGERLCLSCGVKVWDFGVVTLLVSELLIL